MSKPKLPKPVTTSHVDWVEYKKYLEKVHAKEYAKHEDALWRWFCDSGDFHNGCYIHMENAESMGYDEDHIATWFAGRIFADYGKTAADKYGTIRLWVWW